MTPRPLELDFRRARRGSPWPGRVLFVVALAFAGDVGFSFAKALYSVRKSEAALARAPSLARAAGRPASKEEVAVARDTVERLALPWDGLFDALESASSDQVALLGIEPDPKSGSITITGDSKDYLALLTYVLNLSRSEALSRVQLVRHEVKANEPQKPVSFTVSATWAGPRPL